MRFFSVLTTALVAATQALAQLPNPISQPSAGQVLEAGSTTPIIWKVTQGSTVTLTLRSGASNDLIPGVVIVSGTPNDGNYEWTIPADTTRGSDYTIEIVSDESGAVPNYTPMFVIDSSNTVATTTNPTSGMTQTQTSTMGMSGTTTGAMTTGDNMSLNNLPTASSMSLGATSISPKQTPDAANDLKRSRGAIAAVAAIGMGVVYAL